MPHLASDFVTIKKLQRWSQVPQALAELQTVNQTRIVAGSVYMHQHAPYVSCLVAIDNASHLQVSKKLDAAL